MKKKLVVLCSLLCLTTACSNKPSQGEGQAAAPAAVSPVQSPQPGGGSVQSAAQGPVYATYSPSKTMELIKQRKDLLIIDVRSPQELREGKIENSTLIPFWDIMKGNYNIPQGRPLLLICAVGGRSYAAMQILAQKGYTEIYNLEGGIDAWKKANLPLVY